MLKFRMWGYCSWPLSKKIRDNDEIADFQEYIGCRNDRYDYPITGSMAVDEAAGDQEEI